MMKMICAGALALAILGFAPQFTQSAHAVEELGSNPAYARVNLVRIKTVLHLTPEQQVHWPPVEAAFNTIASEQAAIDNSGNGTLARIKRKIVGVTLNNAALMKLYAAARPLIASLDDQQRQAARSLAREMGLGPMIAALN